MNQSAEMPLKKNDRYFAARGTAASQSKAILTVAVNLILIFPKGFDNIGNT